MQRLVIHGFRHGHIFDLLKHAEASPHVTVVAKSEEHPEDSLLAARGITATQQSLETTLHEHPCDIIALGDCYGKRGAQAITALRAGKHVIADKPLCTSLEELEEIESLARANGLCVGVMFDMRDHGGFIALRNLIRSGRIGAVQTISVSGQHPLLKGTRPAWYFEPGMHGGTLNDIAVHAIDFIPWVSGADVAEITAARTWNAKAAFAPHFHDCGQFMLRLSNGGGVTGDVSYLAPDACGYTLLNYWRVTVHGLFGMAETSWNAAGVTVIDDLAKAPNLVPRGPDQPGGYLADFLAEIAGTPQSDARTTASCLAATRAALELQAKAVQS